LLYKRYLLDISSQIGELQEQVRDLQNQLRLQQAVAPDNLVSPTPSNPLPGQSLESVSISGEELVSLFEQ